MSFSYDGYDRSSRQRRSALGFWVPLFLTATVATAGVAAWVWSERREDESDEDTDLSYGESNDLPPPRPPRPGDPYPARPQDAPRDHTGDESFVSRVSGALRRTPSPQQFFDSASKRVAAGFAAAGATVGGALAAIREEDKDDYGDHSRWSEEAARRNVEARSAQSAGAVQTNTEAFGASLRGPTRKPGAKRRTVAIVVSAETHFESLNDEHSTYRSEHPSILSHLPPTDFDSVTVFVLIYSPPNKSRPASSHRAQSLGSSFAAISSSSQSPAEELLSLDPRPESSGIHTPATTTPALSATVPENPWYNSIYAQALRLVERSTMIMPFSTPSGHVHQLKHLNPDVVYMVETLSGERGANVEELKKWVKQIVVVVGGDGGALGGLVDSDDEDVDHKEKGASGQKWWENSDLVGLGKRVEIVDGIRFADDYERRVHGRD